MLKSRMLVLAIAFVLDMIWGDPEYFWHPIRLIGMLIYKLDNCIRNRCGNSSKKLLLGGKILVILVLVISTSIPFLIVFVSYEIANWFGILVEGFLCYTLLATKSLKQESMKVYEAFQNHDIEKARYAVSRIVGRDTDSLTKEGIIKAAVETVAENTSDGIVAPMISIAMGGAVCGFFYKAVNTMDSMVGYKNDKYLYFGRCAAKLDDVVNYIPSRISAFMMIVASFCLRMNWKQAKKIYLRDNRNHASPNSAQTESVCAGALEIQLAGDAWYFGKLYKKPTIGDPIRAIEVEDIKRANQLLYMTAVLCVIALEVCLGLLYYIR